MYFDPLMISDDPQAIASLSQFNDAGTQLPGVYSVDIWVNNRYVNRRNIRFVAVYVRRPDESDASTENTGNSAGLVPCLTKKDFSEMGVNTALYPGLPSGMKAGTCFSQGEYIPQASAILDYQKMRLNTGIPQASMRHFPDGYHPKNGLKASALLCSVTSSAAVITGATTVTAPVVI